MDFEFLEPLDMKKGKKLLVCAATHPNADFSNEIK
jgi:hypothetical protein